MKIKTIITGSTGMVGKAVLIECLEHKDIESVLIINRRSIGMSHPKLTEIIHKDFYDFTPIADKLSGYNACFHCMGVSSVGISEKEYTKLTFDITKQLVDSINNVNNDMVFNYVSGVGTDSSEVGKTMWARVKGKTENYILQKGFRDAYMFRPGAIIPEKGVKSSTSLYNLLYVLLKPLFPLMKRSKNITTSSKLGHAMINSVLKGYKEKHLENVDINNLANLITNNLAH